MEYSNAPTFLAGLLCVVACGFPRPADVGDAGASDGSSDSGVAIHVSPSGDDANDGIAAPVKTLKHAIGIASANTEVTRIILATGTYSASSGEIFPYTVPPDVTIVGPAGGGAILAGGKTSPAITVNSGGLQDLDLQDFTTAILTTGAATLKNIRVLTSTTGLQAESTARLTVENLSIYGTAATCSTGIVLNGSAELVAKTLDTRNLGMTLDAKDESVADISGATLAQDVSCTQASMRVISAGKFHLSDSILDGGSSGVDISGRAQNFDALIKNTIIRNMKNGALGGRLSSISASFQMVGGELSNTAATAVQLITGTWTFTGVTFKQNKDLAIYLQDGRVIMRGCRVTNNGLGVNVFDNASGDFGTLSDPGNNVFQDNNGVGLSVDGNAGAVHISAIGNTWNPNKQGADASGRYPTTETITGPVAFAAGNNFNLASGWSLSR